MSPRRKRKGPGRPALGTRARSVNVQVRLTQAEYAAIAAAVAKENREAGDDGATATVSSWIRDHALDPLGLATFEGGE